jgi:hypothetical protein
VAPCGLQGILALEIAKEGRAANVERLIGTVRRECLDRILVFGAARGKFFFSYAAYYNEVRTHLALGKDAPLGRAVQRTGAIVAIPILSGLHHHYVRISFSEGTTHKRRQFRQGYLQATAVLAESRARQFSGRRFIS